MITSPVITVPGGRRVLLMGARRGSGTTTSCGLVAEMWASARQEQVAAVDLSVPTGGLPHRTGIWPRRLATVAAAEQDKCSVEPAATGRVDVLTAGSHADADGMAQALDALERSYPLQLIDVGSTLITLPVDLLLPITDLVVLSLTDYDGALWQAHAALDWLEASGYQRLVEFAVVLVHDVARDRGRTLQSTVASLDRRARAVRTVGWDARLSCGGPIQLATASRSTRSAYLHGTAAIARALIAAAALTDVASDSSTAGTGPTDRAPAEKRPVHG